MGLGARIGTTSWALVCAASAMASAGQTAQTPHDMHRMHNDPKAYMAALDDPARDAWQKPHEVLTALGLRPGDVVADIGAGSGYFTLRFAHHVGATGKAYAVDVSPDMIETVATRAKAGGLTNVATVHAAPDDPKLAPQSLDVIFICDTWHHIEARPAYLTKIRAALKPGGRFVIVDFHKRELPVGPPPSMKLERQAVIDEVQGNGFVLRTEHTMLPHQYFLEFTPRG